MQTVWWVFEVLAALLTAGGCVAILRAGQPARVFRLLGRWLLVLAGATAVYPWLLGPLQPWIWAGGYAAIVATLTTAMTVHGVRVARRLSGRSA